MPAHNARDLSGLRFGRLVALRQVGHRKFPAGGSHAVWECACDCGAVGIHIGASLLSGHTRSCGCLKSDLTTISKTTHGHASAKRGQSATYKLWLSMRNRPVGRDSRWDVFENFLADMGLKPEGMSLDRIDNERGYSRGNCRWVTPKDQARNRRITRMVEFDGSMVPMAALAERFGIKYHTVHLRYRRGKRGADLVAPLKKSAGGKLVISA